MAEKEYSQSEIVNPAELYDEIVKVTTPEQRGN